MRNYHTLFSCIKIFFALPLPHQNIIITTMETIGSIIKKVMNERGMSVPEFAEKIHRAIRTCYNIFDNNNINVALLRDISVALDHDFFKDLSENYDLAKPIEVDESRRRAIEQFWAVVPRLKEEMNFKGYIIPCSADDVETDVHFPIPDYIIAPNYFLVTIGETFEERYKRYEIDGFKFITIKDKSGASVVLCDNIVCGRQCINIVLDYKTEEEWRNTLELAFVTADKYYNDATKFSIKSAIGY